MVRSIWWKSGSPAENTRFLVFWAVLLCEDNYYDPSVILVVGLIILECTYIAMEFE